MGSLPDYPEWFYHEPSQKALKGVCTVYVFSAIHRGTVHDWVDRIARETAMPMPLLFHLIRYIYIYIHTITHIISTYIDYMCIPYIVYVYIIFVYIIYVCTIYVINLLLYVYIELYMYVLYIYKCIK